MTEQPCRACAMNKDRLRREVRVNEQRERAGKPPVLDRINACKRFIAECVAAGHRDEARTA